MGFGADSKIVIKAVLIFVSLMLVLYPISSLNDSLFAT